MGTEKMLGDIIAAWGLKFFKTFYIVDPEADEQLIYWQILPEEVRQTTMLEF